MSILTELNIGSDRHHFELNIVVFAYQSVLTFILGVQKRRSF